MSEGETSEDEFRNNAKETETDVTTETESEVTGEVESEVTSETTDDVSTPETNETSAEIIDISASKSNLTEKGSLSIHILPQDSLNLEGRHIRAEDFEWLLPPVLPLQDIIVEAAGEIESSDLEKILKNATPKQKLRILKLLPLDVPLQIALPIIEDGIYWKRLCLKSWPARDIWRYSDNWKSMFVHRSVHELIESFVPDKDSTDELCRNMKVYSNYVIFLLISKLQKATPRKVDINLHSEDFDQQLDDYLSSRQLPIYLDFEKALGVFPHLKSLTITLSPTSIDFEDFHFNNADFKCLLRATQKLNGLEKLETSNGNFSNEQFSELLKMLPMHKALKELNFSFNFIDDSTCRYVARMLVYAFSLESLILMNNKISDSGAMSIAAALSVNSNLKKLDLSLNLISDEGAVAIAKVLLSNESLTDLDLSKNKISATSGSAFAELVKKSMTLRSLKMQENVLGENAGKQLLDAVKENHYLLELEVRSCGFREVDEGLIHRAILQNRSKVPYSTYVKNNKDIPASEFLF